MRPSSSLAPVVPRGIAPASGESLPLTDIVSSQLDGSIRTIRITGRGKSTALAHLAAEFFGHKDIDILDEETPSNPPSYFLTVFACRDPEREPDITVHLCEWNNDDVIEYLMAKHPSQCRSVMARLSKSDDLWLGCGAPEVLTPVLDLMIANDELLSFEEALVSHFRSLDIHENDLRTVETYIRKTLLDEEKATEKLAELWPKVDRSTLKLLGHRPVRFTLAKGPLIEQLKRREVPTLLTSPWPLDFIELVAKEIILDSEISDFLGKLVSHPKSQASSNSASILFANDKNWRPNSGRTLQLDYAHLANSKWEGMVAADASLIATRLTGADLKRVNFRKANLFQADLSNADLTSANLFKVNATRTNFSGSKLRMVNAEEASFRLSNMEGVDASHGEFVYSNFDSAFLKRADFSNANLKSTILLDANLVGTDFTGANLMEADMDRLDLRSSILDGASLKRASLNRCDFEGMILKNVVLDRGRLNSAFMTASEFRDVSMRGCHFNNAKLADVDWEGCDLRDCKFGNTHFHMGSTRCGLVESSYPSHGTRTGFYTDDFDEQHFKSPEEIRKANLRFCDLRGADVFDSDFYLVDLRGARYDQRQHEHFARCKAILTDKI